MDAASALAAPRDPLSSLPIPLTNLILAYFPLRPRLVVISLVCKRWRQLVLQQVTSWTKPRSVLSVFNLFPHLRSLRLQGPLVSSAPIASVALPELRELEIYCFDGIPAQELILPFSSLTSLRLDTQCKFSLPLVEKSALSVRVLHLLDDRSENFYSGLQHLHLPFLSAVTISHTHFGGTLDQFPAWLCYFITRHQQQLTSLSIKGIGASYTQSWLASCTFPSVTSLHIDGNASPCFVSSLVAKCAPQVSLSLHLCSPSHFEAFNKLELCSALVDLRLTNLDEELLPQAFLKFLGSCPRLARLSLAHTCPLDVFEQLAHSPYARFVVSLDSLSIPRTLHPLPSFPLYSAFSRLCSLHLSLPPEAIPQTLPSLPSLTELTYDLRNSTHTGSALVSLERLVAALPSLRRLDFCVNMYDGQAAPKRPQQNKEQGKAKKDKNVVNASSELAAQLRQFVERRTEQGVYSVLVYGAPSQWQQVRYSWQNVQFLDSILFRWRSAWTGQIESIAD